MILLISNSLDFATDYVVSVLRSRNMAYLRLDLDLFRLDEITIVPDKQKLLLKRDGNAIDLAAPEIKSILYRAPTHLRESGVGESGSVAQLQRHQWAAFARSFVIFENSKWINPISAVFQAENKPFQLSLASQIGFQIPLTAVTNSIESLSHIRSASVALKAIDSFLFHSKGMTKFLYTSIESADTIAHWDLAGAPVILQEALLDKTDIRVTVVADCAFAIEIKLDEKGIHGDWRKSKRTAVCTPVSLPRDIYERCIAITKRLGLIYGAIDLCLVHGKYVFIEINPTGEWMWLPESVAAQVTGAICDELGVD